MALSANDRKRRQLEREKEALRGLSDSTYPYLSIPFFKYLEEDSNWSHVDLCFDLLGMDAPQFLDDRGPQHFANDDCLDSDEDRAELFSGFKNSIGRAEVMVDLLLDVVTELTKTINRFKREELEKRLADLETSTLSDPAARKAALETAVHIARLQDELGKNVRRTLPQWQVKGV